MLPENIVQLALKSRKKGLTAKEREVLEQWLLENVEGIAGRISPVGRVWFRGTGCSFV